MAELLIAGGGFAGVWAAMAAASLRESAGSSSLRIRVVTRDPFLTIRPRLYETPLPAAVRVPLSEILDPVDVEVTVAEITAVSPANGTVRTTGAAADPLPWDALVLASGSRLRRPPWHVGNGHVFSVDTFDEASSLGSHLHQVTRSGAPGGTSVVVVGSGLAGLEVATALAPRLRDLVSEGGQDGARATVTLVEAADRIAPGFHGQALEQIRAALDAAGVRVVLGSPVLAVGATGVVLDDGRTVPAATVVWTGGLEASPLTRDVADSVGPDGRVAVDGELRPVAPKAGLSVYVAGDAARVPLFAGRESVMSCQHAIPLGGLAGHNAAAELLGRPREQVALPEYVTCVDLGGWGAVFTRGWDRRLELSGSAAKDMKRLITEQLIYPPANDRAAALAAGRGVLPGASTALTG